MPSLTVIHDPDVLRNRYALISQAACHNSHIPYDNNATPAKIFGSTTLWNHLPNSAASSGRIESHSRSKFIARLSDVPINPPAQPPPNPPHLG